VIASLKDRDLVATTREQVGEQRPGLPVWGVVVWTRASLFERDSARWAAEIEAQAIARSADAAREWAERRTVRRCECCGQLLPSDLSLPTGPRAQKGPGGSLSAR
jgi:hypothetical protein